MVDARDVESLGGNPVRVDLRIAPRCSIRSLPGRRLYRRPVAARRIPPRTSLYNASTYARVAAITRSSARCVPVSEAVTTSYYRTLYSNAASPGPGGFIGGALRFHMPPRRR